MALLFADSLPDGFLQFLFIIGIGVVVLGGVLWRNHKIHLRRQYIIGKYGDNQVAYNILSGTVWVGENEEQLLDSLGQPQDIDTKVLKTKSKQVWKYGHQGANRYRVRITFENGIIVGWDMK